MSTTIPVQDQLDALTERLAVAEAQAEQAVTLLNQIMASPAHPAEYALREEYEELLERVDELETRMGNKATKNRVTRIAERVKAIADALPETADIKDGYGHDYGDGR